MIKKYVGTIVTVLVGAQGVGVQKEEAYVP
jgi:hypothetical protein